MRSDATRSTAWIESDVDVAGVRLHVRRLDGNGPPLLLLHGLGVSGAVWQAFGRRLTAAATAIAPDLRGHGASDKRSSGYAPADYAADVAGLIDALDLKPIAVIGHSLGALVALALSGAVPDCVSALVLLDPPLDPDRSNSDVERVYRLRRAPPGDLESLLTARGDAPAVARALATLYRQAADGPFEAHLAAEPGAPWAWDLAPNIPTPTLLVRADPAQGGVLGDEAAQAFAARLPNGRLLHIPGAAHAVHASHGAQVAVALREFLALL